MNLNLFYEEYSKLVEKMPQFFMIPPLEQSKNALLIVANIDEILLSNAINMGDSVPKNRGSMACRLLLQQIFFNDINEFQNNFDETGFPYRLNLPKSFDNGSLLQRDFIQNATVNPLQMPATYHASFSHSRNHVAILLSDKAVLGVDIEDKMVSEAVSQRYFLPQEIGWVQSLPVTEQAMGRKLLWTLKESLIKAQSRADSQLIAGLKINLLDYMTVSQMQELIQPSFPVAVFPRNSPSFNVLHTEQGSFGFSPQWQCGFYLGIDLTW